MTESVIVVLTWMHNVEFDFTVYPCEETLTLWCHLSCNCLSAAVEQLFDGLFVLLQWGIFPSRPSAPCHEGLTFSAHLSYMMI